MKKPIFPSCIDNEKAFTPAELMKWMEQGRTTARQSY